MKKLSIRGTVGNPHCVGIQSVPKPLAWITNPRVYWHPPLLYVRFEQVKIQRIAIFVYTRFFNPVALLFNHFFTVAFRFLRRVSIYCKAAFIASQQNLLEFLFLLFAVVFPLESGILGFCQHGTSSSVVQETSGTLLRSSRRLLNIFWDFPEKPYKHPRSLENLEFFQCSLFYTVSREIPNSAQVKLHGSGNGKVYRIPLTP